MCFSGDLQESEKISQIFADHSSYKEFVSRLHKELLQLNNEKTSNSIRKWAKDLNRHFFKDIQMDNKPMKRRSTSLAMRETQTKITKRYHFTPIS